MTYREFISQKHLINKSPEEIDKLYDKYREGVIAKIYKDNQKYLNKYYRKVTPDEVIWYKTADHPYILTIDPAMMPNRVQAEAIILHKYSIFKNYKFVYSELECLKSSTIEAELTEIDSKDWDTVFDLMVSLDNTYKSNLEL